MSHEVPDPEVPLLTKQMARFLVQCHAWGDDEVQNALIAIAEGRAVVVPAPRPEAQPTQARVCKHGYLISFPCSHCEDEARNSHPASASVEVAGAVPRNAGEGS